MRLSWDNLFSTAVGAFLLCCLAVALLKSWLRAITATTQIALVLRFARRNGQRLWFLTDRSMEYGDDKAKKSAFCREERYYCGLLDVPKISFFRTNVVATLSDVEFCANNFGPEGLRFSSPKKIRYPVSFELSSVYWIGIELPASPMDCYSDRGDGVNCSLSYQCWKSDEDVPQSYYQFIAALVKLMPPK